MSLCCVEHIDNKSGSFIGFYFVCLTILKLFEKKYHREEKKKKKNQGSLHIYFFVLFYVEDLTRYLKTELQTGESQISIFWVWSDVYISPQSSESEWVR